MGMENLFVQNCPTCGRRMQIQVRYLGMTLSCPHCQNSFVAQEPNSIYDETEDPVQAHLSTVLQKLEMDLQKSGILS